MMRPNYPILTKIMASANSVTIKVLKSYEGLPELADLILEGSVNAVLEFSLDHDADVDEYGRMVDASRWSVRVKSGEVPFIKDIQALKHRDLEDYAYDIEGFMNQEPVTSSSKDRIKRADLISTMRSVRMSRLSDTEKEKRLKDLQKELDALPKEEEMVFILEIDGDYLGAFNSKEELDEYLDEKKPEGKVKVTKKKALY